MLVFFLYPEFAYGRSFAVGPDFPVYVWWTRVGSTLGISLVGERPGIPALIATFAGSFRLPLVAAVSGLQYACAVSVSVLVVALVRGSVAGGRVAWMLAGGLAGIFAASLANGYVSNLALTLTFLAAASALAARSTRGVVAAAVLIGAGGLLHPQFFFLGGVILVVVAAWSRLGDAERGWSSDAGRIVLALVGGTVMAGAGLLWTTIGPARLTVATSKDALFRHIGLGRTLARLYRNRLGKNIRRYALYVLLPLAAMGVPLARGFTRRFLVSWAALTLLAVPVGMATGWFPPDRVITFSFALPVLAALGAVALWHLLAPRMPAWFAWSVVVLTVGVLVFATLWSWNRQNAYVKPQELVDSTLAGRIGATQPAGTPLVFIVNNPDSKLGFQTTQVANIARAAVPPDRAKDVYVYVGDVSRFFARQPTVRPGRFGFNLLSRTTLAEIPNGPAAVFVESRFDGNAPDRLDPHLVAWSPTLASSVPGPRALAPLPGEVAPSNAFAITGATVLALMLLWAAGLGWARWTFDDDVTAVAAAPGFGVAILAVVGLTMERVGVPLDSRWGPALVSVVAGGLGYLLFVLQGKPIVQPMSEIDEHPHE
jgi:hypothetical protein